MFIFTAVCVVIAETIYPLLVVVVDSAGIATAAAATADVATGTQTYKPTLLQKLLTPPGLGLIERVMAHIPAHHHTQRMYM